MIAKFPLRINNKTYNKIKTIAERQDRSLNKQIEFILKQFVQDYEKVNGEIKVIDD